MPAGPSSSLVIEASPEVKNAATERRNINSDVSLRTVSAFLGRSIMLPFLQKIEKRLVRDLGDRITEAEIRQSLYSVAQKPPRGSGAPRELQGYILFCKLNRAQTVKDMTEKDGTPSRQDIVRELSVRWNAIKNTAEADIYRKKKPELKTQDDEESDEAETPTPQARNRETIPQPNANKRKAGAASGTTKEQKPKKQRVAREELVEDDEEEEQGFAAW